MPRRAAQDRNGVQPGSILDTMALELARRQGTTLASICARKPAPNRTKGRRCE